MASISGFSKTEIYTKYTQTLRKLSQKQKELEKRLYDGVDKFVNPIIIWGADNKLVFCNQAAS